MSYITEAVLSELHWTCGGALLCLVKYARTTLFNKHTIKNNHTLYPLLPDREIYKYSVHIMAFVSHRHKEPGDLWG